MRVLSRRLISVFAWAAAVTLLAQRAQGRGGQVPGRAERPNIAMTADLRAEVIDGVLRELARSYVFPATAQAMEKAIRARQQNKEYDRIHDATLFAETLTKHLREICHDKHLEVYHSPTPIRPYQDGTAADKERMRQAFRRRGDAANWGFDRVEHLTGNVGYLKMRFFLGAEFAGDTLANAMSLLGNTEAMIVDLRDNGGGDPEMVALVCTYFFSGEPVHLLDLYWRPDNRTRQYWTQAYVPGRRYVGKDVYVLTGGETLSAAEGFAYSMKALKRATIVGETTAGLSHPGSNVPINANFGVVIPQGRTINAVTQTDWEATGVKPDIEVPAPRALDTAHLTALRRLLATEADAERKERLKEAIQKVTRQLDSGPSRPPPAAKPAPQSGEPAASVARGTILALFAQYDLVALPEVHSIREVHEFLQSLLRDPRLVERNVANVVVEFGNARYQNLADRYVVGEDVSGIELRRIWRDTGQFLAWDSPLYEEFFSTVRRVNQRLPPAKRIRVLLGDPPIEWENVHGKADYGRWADRDLRYADVVEREVLQRRQKALLVAGGMHWLNARETQKNIPDRQRSAGDLLHRRHPGKLFAFWQISTPLAGREDVSPDALVVRGSPLEKKSFAPFAPRDVLVQKQVNGEKRWVPLEEADWPSVGEMTDGLIYYGTKSTIVEPAARVYQERDYVVELRRRARILSEFYGIDFAKELDKMLTGSRAR